MPAGVNASKNLPFGELRRTTGGFEAVLKLSCVRFSLIFRAFLAFEPPIVLFLSPAIGGFSTGHDLMKSTIHHGKKLLWFIVLHLGANVHSCLTVFMSGKILDSLGINASVQKIGDVCSATSDEACSFLRKLLM